MAGETKWTPGPWEVQHKRTVFPKGNVTLAVATAEQHRPEAEANAHLIAAAPTLYSTLEAALRYIDDSYSDEDAVFVQRVLNILAKARGEK